MRLPFAILAASAAIAGFWAMAVDRFLLWVALDAIALVCGSLAFYRPRSGENPHAMPRDRHFD